jgi:hypothetical protein
MCAGGLFVLLFGSCLHLGGLFHLFPSPLHSLYSLTLPVSSHLYSCPMIRFSMVYLPYHANNTVVIHLFLFGILFHFVSLFMINLFWNFYYISICSQMLWFLFTVYFTPFAIKIFPCPVLLLCLSFRSVAARRTCMILLARLFAKKS